MYVSAASATAWTSTRASSTTCCETDGGGVVAGVAAAGIPSPPHQLDDLLLGLLVRMADQDLLHGLEERRPHLPPRRKR